MTKNLTRSAKSHTDRLAVLIRAQPTLTQIDDSTTARLPVKSSANFAPFAPASQQAGLYDASLPDQQQGPEFNPRGWAVHLKMLAMRGTLVSVALAEVKKQLRAQARRPRAKAGCPAKKATAMVEAA